MTTRTRTWTALGLVLCAAAAGCSASSAGNDSLAPSDPGSAASAERAIVEADLIQIDSGRLYALSASGSVSVVDVATPGRLALLGQIGLGGEPFEMYRRGDLLLTMWDGAVAADGSLVPAQPVRTGTSYTATPPRDPNSGAAVVVLDVRDPKQIRPVATFPVPGSLADSRLVGDVLYLATYENAACYRCSAFSRTVVTSFDLANPLSMRQVDQAEFRSTAPDSYNLPWGSNWKRSIFVNTNRLYVGGHGDIDPQQYSRSTLKEGIIDVVDISDPSGRLGRGARIQVAGAILSRWQMEERDGVLRVISQRGAGRTGNGVGMPEVDTFTVQSTQSYVPLGHTTLPLPRQEGLRSVRFDKDRAYAITYNQTDPLFTIDLKNPATPVVRGELHMPGFMYYLEPYGDRLIGLGIDRADPGGSLNVSLFDVSNLDQPQMLSRIPFALPRISEDYQILNYEIPEDQDRIQKAFRVFPDGLVAVPFTGAARSYNNDGDSCASVSGGVQLIDWVGDSLRRQALLPMRGNPKRALQKDGELLAVSDSNVTSFSLKDHAVVQQTADLQIGTCVPKQLPNEFYEDEGPFWNRRYRSGFFGCTVALTSASPGVGSVMGVLLALAVLVRSFRRYRA